jgi:hypothetical protein
MRLERTVVRRDMRGLIIDLNSSINLRNDISLLLVGVVFKLDGW